MYYSFLPTINYGFFAESDKLGMGLNKNVLDIETNISYRPMSHNISTSEKTSLYKGNGELIGKMEQLISQKEYKYSLEYRKGF